MWSWGACFFTFFYNQKLAPGYIDADYDNLTDPSAKCSSVIFHVQYKHRVIAAKMSTGIARRTQLASCVPPLLLAQLLHLEPEKIECPQLQERCHRAACRSKLSLFTLRFKIDTPYGVNGFAHICTRIWHHLLRVHAWEPIHRMNCRPDCATQPWQQKADSVTRLHSTRHQTIRSNTKQYATCTKITKNLLSKKIKKCDERKFY